MTVKISDCARCGRPVGIAGREHCARCHYALAHRPVKNQCPGCGQLRKLAEATGTCALCSRTCIRCGQKIGRAGREYCSPCLVKDRRAAAQQPCPLRQARPDPRGHRLVRALLPPRPEAQR